MTPLVRWLLLTALTLALLYAAPFFGVIAVLLLIVVLIDMGEGA